MARKSTPRRGRTTGRPPAPDANGAEPVEDAVVVPDAATEDEAAAAAAGTPDGGPGDREPGEAPAGDAPTPAAPEGAPVAAAPEAEGAPVEKAPLRADEAVEDGDPARVMPAEDGAPKVDPVSPGDRAVEGTAPPPEDPPDDPPDDPRDEDRAAPGPGDAAAAAAAATIPAVGRSTLDARRAEREALEAGDQSEAGMRREAGAAADPASLGAAVAPAAGPAADDRRGPGFVPLVLGGLVAGAIGYAIPTFLLADRAPGLEAERVSALESEVDGLRGELAAAGSAVTEGIDLAPVQSTLEALAARIEAVEAGGDPAAALDPLRADLDALRGAVDPLGGEVTGFAEALAALSAELGAISQDVAGLRGEVSALPTDLAARIDALDARTAPLEGALGEIRDAAAPLPERVAALERDLGARMDAVEAEVAALGAEARDVEAEAEALAREAAANQVRLAVRSGGVPFAEPLEVLGGAVPEALASQADAGVPSRGGLNEDFPARSRAALRAARAAEGPAAGVGGFLQRVTNARSLAPREGDDADAVLSRAEAALREGDLEATLAELQTLPTDVQAEFGDWLARARARLEAERALPDYLSTPG